MTAPHPAPVLLLSELPARFRLEHDELGWRIGIGEVAYCRPDDRGRITSWAHDPAISPEEVRRDVELLRAIIRGLGTMIERGALRSDYVRTVQEEAERLRDAAEEMMLTAQDVNAAADRALERARMHERRAWRGYWIVFAFLIVWGGALAVLA